MGPRAVRTSGARRRGRRGGPSPHTSGLGQGRSQDDPLGQQGFGEFNLPNRTPSWVKSSGEELPLNFKGRKEDMG